MSIPAKRPPGAADTGRPAWVPALYCRGVVSPRPRRGLRGVCPSGLRVGIVRLRRRHRAVAVGFVIVSYKFMA